MSDLGCLSSTSPSCSPSDPPIVQVVAATVADSPALPSPYIQVVPAPPSTVLTVSTPLAILVSISPTSIAILLLSAGVTTNVLGHLSHPSLAFPSPALTVLPLTMPSSSLHPNVS